MVQVCTSIYMLYHSFIFQKIWHGEARWRQFQMIKGGVKNESDFSPLFILSLKTLSFFSLSQNLLLKSNFFRNFLFLRIL